jgi:hypothetical protein
MTDIYRIIGGKLMKKQRELMNKYKGLLLEPKENAMPYDNPTKFGEALANRHAHIIDEALSKWSKTVTKQSKPKNSGKPKAKQSSEVSKPN